MSTVYVYTVHAFDLASKSRGLNKNWLPAESLYFDFVKYYVCKFYQVI